MTQSDLRKACANKVSVLTFYHMQSGSPSLGPRCHSVSAVVFVQVAMQHEICATFMECPENL